jgi:malate dehydrogenase (quinone)
LLGQVLESQEERFAALREFYPSAQENDWKVEAAGQRVQIIKKDPVQGGVLQFGTKLVTASDGSIVAMLGASPGASTAVWIMVEVIKRCFRDNLASQGWANKLKEMIPSYGQSFIENPTLAHDYRACAEFVRRTEPYWTRGLLTIHLYEDPAGNARTHAGPSDWQLVQDYFRNNSR